MAYHPRRIEPVLKAALADTPVVCVLGARQVGKTTLVQRLVPTRTYINFDDPQVVAAAQADPLGFVQNLPQRVILDEVQQVPELLPAIKTVVDARRFQQHDGAGHFLLTGSANLLLLPKVRESLAGRMEIITLHPLTELEKQHGSTVLLNDFLQGTLKTNVGVSGSFRRQLANAICMGGYPEPNQRGPMRARRWFTQYVDAIIERDIQHIAAIQDVIELRRLLELLALRTAQLLNMSSLAKELRLERRTVDRYISVLEKLFLVRRLPAWHRNRAKRLIKTPKVHVLDSGLACSLSGIRPKDWDSPADRSGHVLETFVVQQLIAQASWMDDTFRFSHYRDKDQIEVDLIIESGSDIWGIEVKQAAQIEARDAKGLARLQSQAGKHFQGGLLLYGGHTTYPLQGLPHCFAVPLRRLWE